MRTLIALILISLAACNPESSPEGRSKIRDLNLDAKIDSLKQHDKILLGRIDSLAKQIELLKKK
ncbi:MAG: hypothetical protein EOO92_10900 [Pedobacter sp.]|nr:MAG: hypothetical protein EOO92_10900 [Pedobacter sp.]